MRYDRSWRASAYCAPCALRPEGDMQLVHELTLGLTFAGIASDAMRSAGLTRNSLSTTQHSPSAISGEHPQSGHTHAARVAFLTSAKADEFSVTRPVERLICTKTCRQGSGATSTESGSRRDRPRFRLIAGKILCRTAQI